MPWILIAGQIGKTIGQVLLSLLVALLNGKALKRAFYLLLQKLSKKTKTDADDKIVEEVRKDWQLDTTEEKPNGQ